ncbi:MAG: hypothetical protein J0M37_13290 [Ignavibacteria bacterium]|nr:hypothetical protein [Ignavibacteria bacterium]
MPQTVDNTNGGVGSTSSSTNPNRRINSEASGTMQEFLKLIITITTGFLAFTVTFSEKLYNPNIDSIPSFLFATWIFMGLCISACLFALGSLVSHLDDNNNINNAIRTSNIAYFLLFIGVACFVIFSVTFDKEKYKNDIIRSELTAKEYLQRSDSSFYATANIIKKKWNEDNESYSFTFVSKTDTLSLEVDPKLQQILSYEK